MLKYASNAWYYWKIPFSLFSMFFVFMLLSFLIRINGRKIERENKRLEQVVEERTREVVNQKLIADYQRELSVPFFRPTPPIGRKLDKNRDYHPRTSTMPRRVGVGC